VTFQAADAAATLISAAMNQAIYSAGCMLLYATLAGFLSSWKTRGLQSMQG